MNEEDEGRADSTGEMWKLGPGWKRFIAAVLVAALGGIIVNWDAAKKKEVSDFRERVGSFDKKFSSIDLTIMQIKETLKAACDKLMEYGNDKKIIDGRLDDLDGRLNRVESRLR